MGGEGIGGGEERRAVWPGAMVACSRKDEYIRRRDHAIKAASLVMANTAVMLAVIRGYNAKICMFPLPALFSHGISIAKVTIHETNVKTRAGIT